MNRQGVIGLRLIFMGTPDFAVPSLAAIRGGNQILAVVTQPDRPRGRGQKLLYSPVKTAALEAGLPVLQPAKIRDKAVIASLGELRPDLIVTAAYGQILPPTLLAVPKYGCINVHASLLPRYRGAAPIHWAILRGEETTGITIMYMDAGMDTGDIILQEAIPIGPQETTGELHDRLASLGAEMLPEAIRLIAAGQAPRRPQEASEATYAPLLKREDEIIRWEQPAAVIHNQVRGMNPWPGAYTGYSGSILKIGRSERIFDLPEACRDLSPGTVVSVTNGRGIIVATGAGCLLLTQVKPENGKWMAADAYARGYHLVEGVTLGTPAAEGV